MAGRSRSTRRATRGSQRPANGSRYPFVVRSNGPLGRHGTRGALSAGDADEQTQPKEAAMDLVKAIGTDTALALFCVAGLAATAIAILIDTKTQAEVIAQEKVRSD